MNKPEISIGIRPAPLDVIVTDQWDVESRKLVALYEAAPDLMAALEWLLVAIEGKRNDVDLAYQVEQARAAIAKARGEG